MASLPEEIERRRQAAIQAIRRSHDVSGDDEGNAVALFLLHHLHEMDDQYWLKQCGVSRPETQQVLEILVLESHWGEDDEDGIDQFDFTLPGDATNYVLSVAFDEGGDVCEISMES